MGYPKVLIIYIPMFMLAGTLTSATFAQVLDLDMNAVDESTSLYRAKLTLSPAHPNATQSSDSGESENTSGSIHAVSFEFTVQLGHSNSWLLENDPDCRMTDEEVFARALFLARRDATSLADLRDYMEDDFYREKTELYSRNEVARDRELAAFRTFTDIRLLAVVRYGEFHFFLTVMETPDETHPEIQAGFSARKHGGRYLQTNDLRGDIVIRLFRPGMLQEAIYTRLEQFVQ